MGKFSESNYNLLRTYFDILSRGRTGDDNSYLHGAKEGIFAAGGVTTILYEETSDYSLVAHRFLIQEVIGNDFIFQWQGVASINDASELDVGNKFYFRKDSYFHDWLINQIDFADYNENFVNTDKTFIYFGKLKTITNQNSVYIIEFEGMKDFVLKSLPENNRTEKISEFLSVYFDEVYHEFYNKTKDLWSMIDPKEVNEKFLDYMASKMNIHTDKEKLGGLPLREFVDQLPYWLKRKGTYSAYYALYKTLLTNTRNKLNIYEKWCEWCTQELRRSNKYMLVDDFVDHHIIESYGLAPTGGAGPEYYNQFNPLKYPVYADVAPSGDCINNQYTCGTLRNYGSFTFVDPDLVSSNDEYNIQIDDFDPSFSTFYVYSDKIVPDAERGNEFKNCLSVYMDSKSLPNGGPAIWGVSSGTATLRVTYEMQDRETDTRIFKLREHTSGGSDYANSTSYHYEADIPYFLTIEKIHVPSPLLRLHIFSKPTYKEVDQLEVIELSLHEDLNYDTIFAVGEGYASPSASWTGEVSYLREAAGIIESVGPTGYMILSPHYKVEVDLSSEPIGDSFIIDENTATELVRYWEYLKPVSRFVKYHFLLSPLGKIDEVGESVSLYPRQAARFDSGLWTICDTRYVGQASVTPSSAPTSASEDLGVDSDWFQEAHVGIFKTGYSEWQISHGSQSPRSIIQTWGRNDQIVWPKWHDHTDPNRNLIQWSDAQRGKWFHAHSKEWNRQFVQSVAASAWTITHNMGTSGASGCVFEIIDSEYRNFFPDEAIQLDSNTLKLEFSTPVTGTVWLRDEDYIHYQTVAATEWRIVHDLNITGYIIHFYDSNGYQIHPAEVTQINTNECRALFEEAVDGTAVMVIFRREFKEHDINNVFIPDVTEAADVVLGYWKIGDGATDLFSPETYNNISSELASGSLDSWEEIGIGPSGSFLVNFHVPEGEAYNINEMAVFDKYRNLQFYTRHGDLYKPANVQLDVRYRIRKPSTAAKEGL